MESIFVALSPHTGGSDRTKGEVTMRLYRKALAGESGNHDHLFSTTMQVLIGNSDLERIRELGEREGLTAASMAGRLIAEALAARGNPVRPVAEIALRLDGKRSPVEGSSATRTRATPQRRDIF
jgi:hypothetical protein